MGPPIKVSVKDDNFYLLGPAGKVRIPNWPMPPLMSNHGNYIVSMANVCRWMAGVAEGLGVEIFPGMACSELVFEEGKVVGVVAGEFGRDPETREPGPSYEPGMELRGKYVFLSEGVRGSLAKEVIAKYELSKGHCPQKFGLGMKEIWEIDPSKHRSSSDSSITRWWPSFCKAASAWLTARGRFPKAAGSRSRRWSRRVWLCLDARRDW